MPKDKKEISIAQLTAKTLSDREVKMMDQAADLTKEEEKAEPCEAQDCYYFISDPKCPGPMGDECHYVIKNSKMVMAHKRCHQRAQNGEKKTPNVMIR